MISNIDNYEIVNVLALAIIKGKFWKGKIRF